MVENNLTKSWQLLLLQNPTEDSVLHSFAVSGELKIFQLLKNELMPPEKASLIINIVFILKNKGYLKDTVMGFRITKKGRLYLIYTKNYWGFWAVVLAIIALLLMIL